MRIMLSYKYLHFQWLRYANTWSAFVYADYFTKLEEHGRVSCRLNYIRFVKSCKILVGLERDGFVC